MTKKIIVYPDGDVNAASDLGPDQITRLKECGEFTLHTNVPPDNQAFLRRIQNADAMLLGWSIPNEVLCQATSLELISFTGTGVEKFVDLKLAQQMGISVCNTPGYGNNAVAEHALALLFACARNLGTHQQNLKAGIWDKSGICIELGGKQLGLIGFGGIGQRLAYMALALNMRVSVWTRSADRYRAAFPEIQFKSLDSLLAESDMVSIHIAHTVDTEYLVDHGAMRKMKPGTILINTARGEIIDEHALIAALKDGHIAAAGLDVFVDEPLPQDHPFSQLNNVILTPHIAYDTPQASILLNRIAVDNIVNFYAGQPSNVVTAW